MAMPRLPGLSGSSARISRPTLVNVARAGRHRAAPGLHHEFPVRFLVVADADHVDMHLHAEEAARERQGASPLAGAGLGGELVDPFLLVVIRLRHRRVGLVAAGGRHSLVLVVDLGRGFQLLLQAPRPVEGRRPPQAVDVEDLLGDVDVAVRAHLLEDESHRENGMQLLGGRRASRHGAEGRVERLRQVREYIIPLPGHLFLGQQYLG